MKGEREREDGRELGGKERRNGKNGVRKGEPERGEEGESEERSG